MHPNLIAYNGVEDLNKFTDLKTMERYCSVLLAKSRDQVEFIKKVMDNKRSRVIEFCSGNSRLLYSLSQAGLLTSGVGIEISASRHEFAESWRRRLGIENVQNINGDAMGAFVVSPVGSLSLCITGAFQYFHPISPQAPQVILRTMRRATKIGGTCILELYNHYNTVSMCKLGDGTSRSWTELPPGDPFVFYLSKYKYDITVKTLLHDKVFIAEDGKVDSGRSEELHIYNPTEISDLLESTGFQMTGYYGDWKMTKASEEDESSIIVAKAV